MAPIPASHVPENSLHRFIPPELLSKLNEARSTGKMVGERRVVTMLFCDVANSTGVAERLDPEVWSEIMDGIFEQMIMPVYRYEGTVARLMGDSILAFFGAPIAHEDDPQRAILAGLEIVAAMESHCARLQERHGIDLDVRVGINTGLVVVGTVGSDLRMEYTAQGDAINIAARMEQTALPGTVQVAHETYKLVRSLFEFDELGGIEARGKRKPVLAYRVIGPKAHASRTRGIEGLQADMVGREAELRALQDVMLDLKQGIGRLVCVLGEAGLGKSRLVSEGSQLFASLIGEQGNWYEIGTLSYETNQAYGLFQRLIRRVNGISHNDSDALVREKLGLLVESLPRKRQPRAMQLFEVLLGLESTAEGLLLEGAAFQAELLEVMDEWWKAAFSSRPTVLVFDDMHWSDAASIQLLRPLLPIIEKIPLVLLCALRGERQAPAWQIKVAGDEYHHRYTEISLRPLSDAQSNELVNHLLDNPELPTALRDSIVEKSAGNPFFIEEVVRTLIDTGVVIAEQQSVGGETRRAWRATSASAAFAIPDSLQLLLASRLDRLEDGARGTLQIASVIGRSFYHRVLQAVHEAGTAVDQHLGTLLRLEMIREAARVPEIEYAFRNPLTQEAVYETILLKRRREFHRRVAEAMETLYPERLETLSGLLAHHFTLANRPDKAIEYYRQASRQAVGLHAYDDAVSNLDHAVALILPGELADLRPVLLEERGDVYRLLRDGERAISQYQQALDACERLPGANRMATVRLHRKIVQVVTELKWTVSLQSLQHASESRVVSRAALEESLPWLESEPPHPETVRVLVVLSTDAWRIQDPPDWDASQRFARAAVGMAEQLDSPAVLSRALGALATVLDGRSLLREHLRITQQRLEICRAPGFDDVRESIEAFRSVGAACVNVGEYEQAIPYLREAETLAAEAQIIDQQANALGLQAQCWFRLDRWDAVFATEELWRDLEHRYPRERVGETCFFVALSGAVLALRGDYERAESYRKESFDYMVSMSGAPDSWQRNQFY